jgi:hypothetical protein
MELMEMQFHPDSVWKRSSKTCMKQPRSVSAFSGCHAEFHESRCPTKQMSSPVRDILNRLLGTCCWCGMNSMDIATVTDKVAHRFLI